MMDAKNIINFLNSIEKEFDIESWKYRDLDFWPVLRLELYASISTDLLKMPGSNSLLKRLKELFFGNLRFPFKYISDFKKNASLAPSEVLFLSDGISFTNVNGLYFEKFIDPIRTELESRNISSLRLDPYHNYIIPRYSSSVFIQPFLDPIIIGGFLFRNKSNPLIEPSVKARLLSFFSDKGVSKFSYVIDQAEMKASLIFKLSLYFEKKLLAVKPKIVFIVWYYGVYGMALVLACKRLSIPTVDVQHGVQGDLHAAYGGWENVPKVGFNTLPNFFWCWSQSEVQSISKWSSTIDTHQPWNGGNLFLNKWKSESYSFAKFYHDAFYNLDLKGKRILVSLSPGIWGPEVLGELFKTIKETQSQYSWMIRLHPNMLSQKSELIQVLDIYGITKYELENVTKFPLYAVLQNTDLHITHSSSTVLEAANFQILSIVVNEYGKELYSEMITSDIVRVRISSESILDEIRHIFSNDRLLKSSSNNERNENIAVLEQVLDIIAC